MGSISVFGEIVNTRKKRSTVMLSILSRIALCGASGLAADRILTIAGLSYYKIEGFDGNRTRRTRSQAGRFLAELEKTGFVEQLDPQPFGRYDPPKYKLTEKGRSKLVKLKEDFDRENKLIGVTK